MKIERTNKEAGLKQPIVTSTAIRFLTRHLNESKASVTEALESGHPLETTAYRYERVDGRKATNKVS